MTDTNEKLNPLINAASKNIKPQITRAFSIGITKTGHQAKWRTTVKLNGKQQISYLQISQIPSACRP